MNNAPSISVIIPVKNGETHINEAIQSILNQTFTDFELIVVNDHSTDSTKSICQSIRKTDNRIVLIENQGEGLVCALNTGIKFAKAPYIARMDADDIAYPQRLEKQYNYMLDNPDCDVVGTFMRIIGWNSTDGFRDEATTDVTFPLTHSEMIESLKSVGKFWVLSHPTVMTKTNVIRKVGGYRDRYARAEDLDLWVRLALSGHQLANIGETLLDYRASETSVTSSGRLERYLSTSVLIGFMYDGQNSIEATLTDPLSIKTISLYGKSDSAINRICNFAILLRGLDHDERKKAYYRIKSIYSEENSDLGVRLIEEASKESSWPSDKDQLVIEDIVNIFLTD